MGIGVAVQYSLLVGDTADKLDAAIIELSEG